MNSHEKFNLFVDSSYDTLNILYKQKLLDLFLDDLFLLKTNNLYSLINDCIYNNEFEKMKLLNDLCKNESCISCDAYFYAVNYHFDDIVEWIDKYKPIEFMGKRISFLNSIPMFREQAVRYVEPVQDWDAYGP